MTTRKSEVYQFFSTNVLTLITATKRVIETGEWGRFYGGTPTA